jgi:hypothetical protein
VTKRIVKVPGPTGGEIFAEDMEYETIKEDWNSYKLADGSTLRIKLVVQNIYRALMDDKKELRYTPNGIPLYSTRWTVVLAPDVPEELLKKSNKGE